MLENRRDRQSRPGKAGQARSWTFWGCLRGLHSVLGIMQAGITPNHRDSASGSWQDRPRNVRGCSTSLRVSSFLQWAQGSKNGKILCAQVFFILRTFPEDLMGSNTFFKYLDWLIWFKSALRSDRCSMFSFTRIITSVSFFSPRTSFFFLLSSRFS